MNSKISTKKKENLLALFLMNQQTHQDKKIFPLKWIEQKNQAIFFSFIFISLIPRKKFYVTRKPEWKRIKM
jgi:hypothetical protein